MCILSQRRVFYQELGPSEGNVQRIPGRACNLDAVKEQGWWNPGALLDTELIKFENKLKTLYNERINSPATTCNVM